MSWVKWTDKPKRKSKDRKRGREGGGGRFFRFLSKLQDLPDISLNFVFFGRVNPKDRVIYPNYHEQFSGTVVIYHLEIFFSFMYESVWEREGERACQFHSLLTHSLKFHVFFSCLFFPFLNRTRQYIYKYIYLKREIERIEGKWRKKTAHKNRHRQHQHPLASTLSQLQEKQYALDLIIVHKYTNRLTHSVRHW